MTQAVAQMPLMMETALSSGGPAAFKYSDPGMTFISVENTDSANLGQAALELKGKSLTGLLVVKDALELRTNQSVSLQPGYGTLASPALEAFPTGNVSVLGALTAASVVTPSLTLGGSDVATALAPKAQTADLTSGLQSRYTKGEVDAIIAANPGPQGPPGPSGSLNLVGTRLGVGTSNPLSTAHFVDTSACEARLESAQANGVSSVWM